MPMKEFEAALTLANFFGDAPMADNRRS